MTHTHRALPPKAMMHSRASRSISSRSRLRIFETSTPSSRCTPEHAIQTWRRRREGGRKGRGGGGGSAHQQRQGEHAHRGTPTRVAARGVVTHENTAREGDPLGIRRVAVGAERREAADHGGVRRVQRAITRPAALHSGRRCVALAAIACLPRTARAPARRRRLDACFEKSLHVARNRGAPQRPVLGAARLEVDHPPPPPRIRGEWISNVCGSAALSDVLTEQRRMSTTCTAARSSSFPPRW